MPVKDLLSKIDYAEWAGLRYRKLDGLERFLEGKAYEHLQIPFSVEKEGNGRYVPLRERRPSVIYNIPKVIVSRTSRLLFGGKHWPKFQTSNKDATDFLQNITDTSDLQRAMLEAARIGSIGSVAVVFYIKEEKFFFDVINPKFCQPRLDDNRELDSLLIMYPVFGYDLIAVGYNIEDEDVNEEFLFAKKFTKQEEIFYQPIKSCEFTGVSDLQVDTKRTVEHNMGLVPAVWIKNLPPTNSVDGGCTFEQVLNFCVEIDYQLSQCGRGLKYNADPQLLVKEGMDGSEEGLEIRSTASTLIVGEKGDAKLLQIDGAGQKAVLEYVKQVRQYALEVACSSRKDPESSYGNMSGRAMEILDADLISIVSELRLTYGESGLKPLCEKIIRAAVKAKILDKDFTAEKGFNIDLYWGNWFEPTPVDLTQIETALSEAVKNRRMYSHEARMITATVWDIGNDDPEALEAQWPLPPEPPISAEVQAELDLKEKKIKATPGDDGRGNNRAV